MDVTTNKINFGPLYIAFAAFLWTTDVFLRTNLEGLLTSVQITLLDHTIIVLVISPFIVKYGPALGKFTIKEWFAVLWIGIGGSALATIFLTEGFFVGEHPFQYVGLVVLLQQSQPIIAIGLAHLLLKEKLPRYYYLLTAIAIIGVLLIIAPNLINESGELDLSGFQKNLGVIAAFFGFLAAVFWGSSTVMGRYLLEHGSEKREYKQMTTYRFLIAFLFLVIFTPFLPRSNGYPTLSGLLNTQIILSILYLSLIVGLASLIIYYYGLKTTHASVSAIAELTYPLSYYIFIPLLIPIISPNAWYNPPNLIQGIGGVIFLFATTAMSYIYGKIPIQKEIATVTA